MDQIDRKIINMLEQNARASLKELSAACYISSPAIAARIAKLEKAGIITGYHASVNFEKLDYHVKAFIQIQLEPRQKGEFYPFVKTVPNIIECNCVTGDYSELMEVVLNPPPPWTILSMICKVGLARPVPKSSFQPVLITAASPSKTSTICPPMT